MRLTRLRLRSIRAYDYAQLDPPPGMAVLFGPNGEGKTTILEAAGFLGTLRSFRTGRSAHLLKTGSSAGEITGRFSEPAIERSVEIRPNGKRLTQNGGHVFRAPAFIEGFRVVILAPEHAGIVGGAAEERRRFLDRLLFSLNPGYLDFFLRYHRALRQKQALLKAKLPLRSFLDQVAPWNIELASYAEVIRKERRGLTANVRPLLSATLESLAPQNGEVSLEYSEPAVPLPEELAERAAAEHAAGKALCGPHRDDLVICLRGEEAGRVASQGERASILLGLKLSETALIEKGAGDPPMLLLDDLGATLDAARRAKLLAHLEGGAYQGLVTTADDGVLRAAMGVGARAFRKKTEQSPEGFSIARWLPA
ncbi:MAG: DNA replication and repair protein RecF [Pseudomonadota bacterium]